MCDMMCVHMLQVLNNSNLESTIIDPIVGFTRSWLLDDGTRWGSLKIDLSFNSRLTMYMGSLVLNGPSSTH
jgi:hypothetical protein